MLPTTETGPTPTKVSFARHDKRNAEKTSPVKMFVFILTTVSNNHPTRCHLVRYESKQTFFLLTTKDFLTQERMACIKPEACIILVS